MLCWRPLIWWLQLLVTWSTSVIILYKMDTPTPVVGQYYFLVQFNDQKRLLTSDVRPNFTAMPAVWRKHCKPVRPSNYVGMYVSKRGSKRHPKNMFSGKPFPLGVLISLTHTCVFLVFPNLGFLASLPARSKFFSSWPSQRPPLQHVSLLSTFFFEFTFWYQL